MTSRQTAEHILAGILSIAEDKREDVASMREAGLDGDADIAEVAMNALLDVASGLLSSINDGEYD